MATENLPTSDKRRHSNAYIHTLVNQLTSSKPTQTTNNNNIPMAKPKNNQNSQNDIIGHKKQVRRRLHTSRPYQERLLNMAKARKEIVTALKFHRATMKQANEKKQLQEQEQKRRLLEYHHQVIHTPKIETFIPNKFASSYNNNNCSPSWESLNIPLPNQTLGLNLNLQAFANLDTTFCHNNNNYYLNNNTNKSSPSSSTSSNPRDVPIGVVSTNDGLMGPTSYSSSNVDYHACLDEEEMEKIRSIGEQHQIEWDDTLNLVKSTWWLKYFNNNKHSNDNNNSNSGGSYASTSTEECSSSFYNSKNNNNGCLFEEEFMEIPQWLNNAKDDNQHVEDSSSEGTSLPWVNIGDIDGMDEEWLS